MASQDRYDCDVFISHAGAGELPRGKDSIGWLTALVSELEVLRGSVAGPEEKCRVRTGEDTGDAEQLTETTKTAISTSAVFLVVLSEAYLASPRCAAELEQFHATGPNRPIADSQVFLIEIERIERRRRPFKLQDCRGYRFFDETGEDSSSGSPSVRVLDTSDEHYWEEFRRLAECLKRELERIRICESGADTDREPASPAAVVPRDPKESRFDVFLCHNTEDKAAVKRIGEDLKRRGIRPWLDQWELRPGVSWQEELEQQIESILAAAVFIGPHGMGPWQNKEQQAFVSEFIERQCPVIPVILPGVVGTPEFPRLLRGNMWVDFRNDDPDPLNQLIWGITSEKPRPVVFLAEATDDLYWERMNLAERLEKANVRVLPGATLYPEDFSEYVKALDRDLAGCDLFVQLLSERVGDDPSRVARSFVHVQYERARQAGIAVRQWRDPKLPMSGEIPEMHRALFEGEDVWAMGIEEFKKRVVANAWSPAVTHPAAAARRPPLVHIHSEPVDRPLAKKVVEILKEHAVSAHAAASSNLRQLWDRLHGMVFVYGTADETDVTRDLLDCDDQRYEHEPPPLTLALYQEPAGGQQPIMMSLPDMVNIEAASEQSQQAWQQFVGCVKDYAAQKSGCAGLPS